MIKNRNFEGISILESISTSIDETNNLVIPEFQRSFAWSVKDVSALFESVFSGFPIGSILTWTPHKASSMTYKTIRGDPNESKDGSDSLCGYLCKHPDHLSSDSKQKKYLLDGQQRMKSLYYGLLFPCHQEIFRPKKTKTQPFTFVLYTSNGRDFEVRHFSDLINERYQTDNFLLLYAIDLVLYGQKNQIELTFHYFESDKPRSHPTVWKYGIVISEEMDELEFKGFLFDEQHNVHRPSDDILKRAFLKGDRGILISTFVDFTKNLEIFGSKMIWSHFYEILRSIPADLSIAENYSEENKKRLKFEHDTIFKFLSSIDTKLQNLINGIIGEISITGSLSEMVVIFDKLNMSGVRLSTMDLLVAKTYQDEPDNFNLRNILSQFDDDDEILGFFGKEQFLGDKIYLIFLKTVSLIYRQDLREKSMLDLNRNELKEILITNQEQINKAIDTTIEFFRSIPKLPHLTYVRYESQISILIAIYYNIYTKYSSISGIKIENIIRNHYLAPWYWRVVFPAKFGMNSRENARRQYVKLNQIIENIAQSILDNNYHQRVRDFERQLDIITEEYKLPTYEEVSELPDGRSFTPLNLLPFAETGSTPNLNSGIGDSLSNTTKNFQVHHIFPFNLHKINPQITKLLIDHPLNMLIIDGGLNSHISSKYPDDYFREFKENYEKFNQSSEYEEYVLRPNFIPSLILDYEKLNLHGVYLQFLEHRYKMFSEYLEKLQRRNWSEEENQEIEDLSLENFEINGVYISTEHFLPKSHVRDILREETGMNVQGELIDYLSSHLSAIILSILKDHNYDLAYRSYWIENYNIDLEFITVTSRLGSEALFDRIRKFANCKKNASLTDQIRRSYYYLLKQIGLYLQQKSVQQNMKTLMRRDIHELTLSYLKNEIFPRSMIQSLNSTSEISD